MFEFQALWALGFSDYGSLESSTVETSRLTWHRLVTERFPVTTFSRLGTIFSRYVKCIIVFIVLSDRCLRRCYCVIELFSWNISIQLLLRNADGYVMFVIVVPVVTRRVCRDFDPYSTALSGMKNLSCCVHYRLYPSRVIRFDRWCKSHM